MFMSENSGMTAALTVVHVETYKTETEAQRCAKAALLDVARTLSGVSVEDADAMRKDFTETFGRATAFLRTKARSSGSGFTASTELDWVKAGQKPPLLAQLHEAAGHVYKLRKLGAFPADQPLTVDMANLRDHHSDRWAGK